MRGLATIADAPRQPEPASSSPRGGRGARARRPRQPAAPLLVTKEEAARVLGMSISHFQRHVQPEVECVHSGQLTLYPYDDLRRWAEAEATIGGRTDW